MKLLFDEDLGDGLPTAFHALGKDAIGVRRALRSRLRRAGPGSSIADEEWLTYAGRTGFLVISCNLAILNSDAQRQALIDAGAGAIFITTGQERRWEIARLLMRKWSWFEEVDQEPRPFAYRLGLRGRPVRDERVRQ